MKRAIVKCKLKSRDDFVEKLAEIDMEFGPVYWIHDRIYVPRNYKKNSNYPRLLLRTEMKAVDRPPRYELILRRHIEDSGVDVVDRTVIKDYTEAANIVMQLGFELKAEVIRRRQEIIMNEGTQLYLDKVDGLAGTYAKLEADLDEKDKPADVIDDLINTFKVLGQSEKSVVRDAYSDFGSDATIV